MKFRILRANLPEVIDVIWLKPFQRDPSGREVHDVVELLLLSRVE
jgi:hypothetical protein